jgi:regulator of protease activity HflC (stomatin/prohibitin superfamily)
MFGGGIHLILRIVIAEMAKERLFFTSPNIGRIQQRIRAGRVVSYIANLKGLTEKVKEKDASGNEVEVVKYIDIDEEAGTVIFVNKPIWRGFCWKVYGARFIGLDDIQAYDLEITKINPDNSVKTELVTAHSLHYSGIYPVILEGDEAPETKEGTPINIRLRITTRTRHAGHCLKYKSQWLKKLESAVKSALRDFIGIKELRALLVMQNEKPTTADAGLVGFIRSLNTSEAGNSGLIDTLGQEIVDVNLESIKIPPEVEKALKQKQLAEETKAAELAQATKDNDIAEVKKKTTITNADAEAEKIRRIGIANNEILRGQFNAVGGTDGVVGLAQWEALKDIRQLNGTLVINSGGDQKTPLIINPTHSKKGG